MKYLVINLTKCVQYRYENYKTLMNKMKQELYKWRDVTCSWIERLNIAKTSVLPNWTYRFNAITIKIPASYFICIEKLILNFMWRDKRLRTANTVLKKKNKVEGLILPNFKTYYKL